MPEVGRFERFRSLLIVPCSLTSTQYLSILVFPQPAEAEVLPQPWPLIKCLAGRTSSSVWWLQIVWTLRPRA